MIDYYIEIKTYQESRRASYFFDASVNGTSVKMIVPIGRPLAQFWTTGLGAISTGRGVVHDPGAMGMGVATPEAVASTEAAMAVVGGAI